ncbi:MAG: hypothetical protein ACREVL_14705 [Solimonas sp.]
MRSSLRLAAIVATFVSGTGIAHADAMPINLIMLMPGDKDQRAAFAERLRQIPYFAKAEDENNDGSTLLLIVSVAQVPTGGGAAASATTGLLAASTLGLIPTVENKNVVVHYEVRANSMSIASFDYTQNFTSVSNIFGNFGKLPDDAREWLMKTIDDLGRDAQGNTGLAALQAEYDVYFGKR